MAKRNREITMSKIEKRISGGRGIGEGKDYDPWLYIQDVPSSGVATRSNGWKTGRIHHLMSKLEHSFFYIFEWSDRITDIREQFPLLPVEETVEIAESLGIKHPVDDKTKDPIVLTTDFLINIKNDMYARTIKPCSKIDFRVAEKYEIERRYWKKRNVDWGILTDTDIPEALVSNIDWFYSEHENIDAETLSVFSLNGIEKLILRYLEEGESLAKACAKCDEKSGLEMGTSLALVKHFLATKKWIVDMGKKINPSQSIQILEVKTPIEDFLKEGGRT